MPVPKATTDNSPRRLLRDVVFDKMLEAIQDGTLQRGERLNDDELVQWLGVSRTPIREAIAKLVDLGLVEMEANRYTRIANPDPAEYLAAAQMMAGLNELAAEWAFPQFDDDDVAGFRALIERTLAHVEAQDHALRDDSFDLIAYLVDRTHNPLLLKSVESISARTSFLAAANPGNWNWDIVEPLNAMLAAAEARDGEAGGAAVRALAASNARAFAAVQAEQAQQAAAKA
jgi:DNA-binding GntR family transcriptional regulator